MNVPNDTKDFEWTFQAQCQQVILSCEKCYVTGFSMPSKIYVPFQRTWPWTDEGA